MKVGFPLFMLDIETKILFELVRIYSELSENQVEVDEDLPQLTYNDLWELYE
jgi:hypothetical protein